MTNRKASEHQGRVQLIDASAFWVPMRKSLGDKRREIPPERAQDIVKILADFKDGDTRRITKDGTGKKEEEVVVGRRSLTDCRTGCTGVVAVDAQV